MPPVKPSESEEEYFARQEMERRRNSQKEIEARMKDEERARLKELHHMRCPKCGMELSEYEYRDIKLDRCSSCGGIWFDQGEMEELLGKGRDFFERFKSLFG
ncbi:MAG TPA: zf-TFIIB domain-containing protein [Thermoanaerobaculia bacterium]|nr:zf-TFIIB domain-containing protein [Thermoanaerobaculia bacterium]